MILSNKQYLLFARNMLFAFVLDPPLIFRKVLNQLRARRRFPLGKS